MAAQELARNLGPTSPPANLKLPTPTLPPPRREHESISSDPLISKRAHDAALKILTPRQKAQLRTTPEASALRNTPSYSHYGDNPFEVIVNRRDWHPPINTRLRRISPHKPPATYPTLQPSPLQEPHRGPLQLDQYHHVPRSLAWPDRLAVQPPSATTDFLFPYFDKAQRFAYFLPPLKVVLERLHISRLIIAMDDKPNSPLALREKPGDSTPHQTQPTEQSPQGGGNAATETEEHPINPYEADPFKIPKTDKYLSHHPHYGRYLPQETDFRPDERYIMSTSSEAFAYWEQILTKCNHETRINFPREDGRDTFAVGSVIVKSGHLSSSPNKYNGVDCNEDAVLKQAAKLLPEFQLPRILHRPNIRGRNVLFQSRIPGVSLKVAWPYLTTQQKRDFKDQARAILLRMRKWKIPDKLTKPQFVSLVDKWGSERDMTREGQDCLFDRPGKQLFVCHNDMRPSNLIVNDNKIVGIVGWGDMGFFTWEGMSDFHLKKCVDNKDIPIPELFEFEVPWYDLYDIPGLETRDKAAPTSKGSTPMIELAPAQPTPKKVEDLKRKSASRASSSERSSPVPQPASQQAPKKRPQAPPPTKKGTAKRNPAPKRRKLNDSTSVDDGITASGRESTPGSRSRKTPAQRGRKQDSLSVTGSPAPENNKKARKGASTLENEMDMDEEEDDDEGKIFCVCRRPDNHTWMIGCDGGCEDWFHGKCMNINQIDADLIDKYICPSCEKTCGMHTTWKPMCRAPACRQPARVWLKTPSKYCSDEHGHKFLSRLVEARAPKLRVYDQSTTNRVFPVNTKPSENQDDEHLGAKGGTLTSADLKAAVSRVKMASEFRNLGHTPLSFQQEGLKQRILTMIAAPISYDELGQPRDIVLEAPDDKVQFTPEELEQMNSLRNLSANLSNRKEMLAEREKFLGISRQRAKTIFERLQSNGLLTGIQWKDACGFDSRFSQSDKEFDEWRRSEAGRKTLDEGVDGDETLNSKDEDDSAGVESIAQGICLKKRCERHKQWLKVMQQDNLFEQTTLEEQTAKCEKDTEEFITKVVMRVPDEET